LEGIIDYGNKLTAARYYAIATTTIFFYDFLLTLADEIKYAWQGKRSWVFAIFLANRYLPIAYQILFLYTSYSTTFHQRLCDKTAFIEILATVIPTFLAQVVIALRIYAVTSKNRTIASCFSAIIVLQLILGIYMTAYGARGRSAQIQQIPLPVYMICLFVGRLSVEIVFTTVSLAYDILAFSVIIHLVVRSNVNRVPLPGLLKTIVQDATYYFLVIFTSHLLLVMFLAFGSDRIKLLPAPGNTVYLPVMITRLLLSLKKASASQQYTWNLGETNTHSTTRFVERRGGVATGDGIPLNNFASRQEGP